MKYRTHVQHSNLVVEPIEDSHAFETRHFEWEAFNAVEHKCSV